MVSDLQNGNVSIAGRICLRSEHQMMFTSIPIKSQAEKLGILPPKLNPTLGF